MTGLYVHVPFCVRKCLYCDFYSVKTCPDRSAHREKTDQTGYLTALGHELARLPDDFRPHTIFIGGGTPTELSETNLQRLLDRIQTHVPLDAVREWTCELNPRTLTAPKARRLKEAGVNRVSLGVQSFDPTHLKFLGRQHGPDDVHTGYALLRETGFRNISLDIMYAIPGSDKETTRSDMEQLIALCPEHVSCYGLIYEEGTPLMTMKRKGLVTEVDVETERAQYNLIRAMLKTAGYDHYELSNFALPGRTCLHNRLYWEGGAYIGCGPAAHSHWHGRRYANVPDLQRYISAMTNGDSAVEFEETLDPEAKARETLVMGLRLLEGVHRDMFHAATGYDYRSLAGAQIDQLIAIGMLEEINDTLRLTERALFVSDGVFAELV